MREIDNIIIDYFATRFRFGKIPQKCENVIQRNVQRSKIIRTRPKIKCNETCSRLQIHVEKIYLQGP